MSHSYEKHGARHKHEIACLDAKLKALSTSLKTVSNTSDLEEMSIIIHRPGWTTIAELALVNGIVESIQAHAENLTEMRKVLLSGSRAVEIQPQPLPPGKGD
jgi:hypothetical protein